MALIIGVVIVLLILFGFLCYKKAPPTEAIVVTGFTESRLWQRNICAPGTAACGPTEHAPSENRCQDSGDRR